MLPADTDVRVTGVEVTIEVTFAVVVLELWVVVAFAVRDADDWDCCAATKGTRMRKRRGPRGAIPLKGAQASKKKYKGGGRGKESKDSHG